MAARQTTMQLRTVDTINLISASARPVSELAPKTSNTPVEKWRQLEKLMGKELTKWWEATALEKYIEAKRFPRGLRIYTVPTYDSPNPRLLKDWTLN